MKDYDAHAIEQKWRSVWETEQTFHVDNPAPGSTPEKVKTDWRKSMYELYACNKSRAARARSTLSGRSLVWC